MNVFRSVVAAAFVALVSLSCTSKTKTGSSDAGAQASPLSRSPKAWPEKMQLLSNTLSELMPLISSRKKFSDPKNAVAIDTHVSNLKSLAHSLKTGPQPSADPSMQVVSGLMEDDIARALDALRSGNRDYARHVLRDTTSYCIQCHTQTNNGPEFPRFTLAVKLQDLSLVERAEFFAATRQFEPALESYRAALKGAELAKEDPFEYEAAARTALAISVRVHKDPKEAKTLVQTVRKNKNVNTSIQKNAAAWDRSVSSWSKEKPLKDPTPPKELAEAERLIAMAQKNQEFPLDHSQDITYFRASSLLHSLLQQPSRTDEFSARALYLAGLASEATRDMSFWTMHETMYEQCIRIRPETEQAKQCFGRLKDSVVLGYSGSAGTQIPPDINRRLANLKKIAFGEVEPQ